MEKSILSKALEAKAAEAEANAEAIAETAEWAERASENAVNRPITTVQIAAEVKATGYPKVIRFGGIGSVTLMSDEDAKAFWKAVYLNLTKSECEEVCKTGKKLSDWQICSAMRRHAAKSALAADLIEEGVEHLAESITVDDVEYVIVRGLAVDLDGNPVCDVDDVDGLPPEEKYVALTDRIRESVAAPEEDDCDYPDYPHWDNPYAPQEPEFYGIFDEEDEGE